MDPTAIEPIGTVITNAFQEFRFWSNQRREQREELKDRERQALRALQRAVLDTSSYIGNLEAGAPGHREEEIRLSELWSDAALKFYGVNDRISPLLHLKAVSWSRPARWIDEKVVEAGITLDEMNELVLQLLGRDDTI